MHTAIDREGNVQTSTVYLSVHTRQLFLGRRRDKQRCFLVGDKDGLPIEKQLLHLYGASRRDSLRADQLLPHVLQLLLLLHMAGSLLTSLSQDPGQSLVLLLSLLQLLLQLDRRPASNLQSACSHATDIGIRRYCAISHGDMCTQLQDYTRYVFDLVPK